MDISSEPEQLLVLRTAFFDEATWHEIRSFLQDHADYSMDGKIRFVDDRQLDGLDPAGIVALEADATLRDAVFTIDRVTLVHPEHPVLVVGLGEAQGQTFRALPVEVPTIHANLAVGNLLFDDFVEMVGDDDIYRGD